MRLLIRVALPVVVASAMFGVATTYAGGSPGTASSGARAAASTCPAPRAGIQKGVAVLWRQLTVSTPDTQRAQDIARYAKGVGANSLSINFLINTSGVSGNRVYAGSQTPSPASLRQIITAAKSAGLRVSLRPLIDESNIPRPHWRGTIKPASATSWFKSYGDLMVTYAKLARSTCADELVVGVELNSMQHFTAQWKSVADRVRAAGFHGDLAYSANWNAPMTFPFVRRPGVDFYPALNVGTSATPAQVTAAMTKAFKRYPRAFRKNLVVQETGFPAEGGTYSKPALWNAGTTPTLKQQATWFSSACSASRGIHAKGIYFWTVDSWADPFNPDPKYVGTFGFERRPAEAAVRSCFAKRW
ncbi:MAG: hypothetical protein JWP74_3448 [Marmoricola sp.]|nr:hypothetical protein [Marmoricola sp.]